MFCLSRMNEEKASSPLPPSFSLSLFSIIIHPYLSVVVVVIFLRPTTANLLAAPHPSHFPTALTTNNNERRPFSSSRAPCAWRTHLLFSATLLVLSLPPHIIVRGFGQSVRGEGRLSLITSPHSHSSLSLTPHFSWLALAYYINQSIYLHP